MRLRLNNGTGDSGKRKRATVWKSTRKRMGDSALALSLVLCRTTYFFQGLVFPFVK